MGVLQERFPDDIAAGAEGGWPGWLVTIVEHAGGTETPTLDDPHPKGRWNVARAVEFSNKHEHARRHFVKARSTFHRFRFKDWSDYLCTRTGDDRGRLVAAGAQWQCSKVYGADEPTFEYVRPLTRLVPQSESIWRDTALQVRGVDYTVDNDTGLVTPAVSWAGATLELACEFDVLCRYDVERLSATLVFKAAADNMLLHWPDIDIVEVREEEA